MTDGVDGAIWVRTEPTIDGKAFMVTLEVSDDHSIALNRSRSIKHALAVLTAVEYACMDGAIMKQMKDMVGVDDAAALIHDLRQERPEIDFSISKPFSLQPLCTVEGKPFLYVLMDGEIVGQWEVDAAREHALACLGAFAVADLDGAYLRHLRGVVGLPEETARAAVADLVRFR